jgi:hypothetical protein
MILPIRKIIVFQLEPHYLATIGKHHAARYEGSNGYCLRSISRDPDVYPEPEAFKPQRWIDNQYRLRDDLKFFVYGFGRRQVPPFSYFFPQ